MEITSVYKVFLNSDTRIRFAVAIVQKKEIKNIMTDLRKISKTYTGKDIEWFRTELAKVCKNVIPGRRSSTF